MRPRPRKASSLSTLRRAAVVATLAALAVIFVSAGSAKPAPVGNYQVCLSAAADSCTATSAGGDYSVLSGANPQLNVTVTNDGSSNQTLDYADVTVPGGIGLSVDTTHSPQSASYTTYAGTSTSTTLQLRGLALAPGASKTVSFYVNSTNATCTDGTWTTLAKTGSQPSAFVFSNPPVKASGLTSLVAKSCTLDFIQPAAALENTTITSEPYTAVTQGGTASYVTVTPHGLPVALNGGTVTLGESGSFDPGSAVGFTGDGPAPFSSGSVVYGSLQSSGTGGPFTLTATAYGFQTATSSSFVITQDGESCNGACSTLNGKAGNNPLVSIATSGGFSYVGASPSGVPQDANGNYPAGCQSWTPTTGASGFVEFDGRTTGGSLQISYFVSQTVLKARYGKNTGNQFVPICFGVKYLDANQQPLDCRTNPNPGGGWLGDELTANAAFDGKSTQALCGAGGFYWGILSSYQDKLDQSVNPVVTGFNGPTNPGQNFRTFVISIPPGIDARGGC